MQRTNASNRFFTEDLYADFNETGNAFLGYHIANNFSRLLGLTGTVYFRGGNIPLRVEPIPAIIADIPIDNCQFIHAPVVQLWAVSDNYSIATTFTRATFSGGTTLYDIPISEYTQTSVGVNTSIWSTDTITPPLVARVGEYLKIGETSSELMGITSFSQLPPIDHGAGYIPARYEWQRRYVANRNNLDTSIEDYIYGENIFHVGENGTSIVGLTGMSQIPSFQNRSWGQNAVLSGSSIEHNPIFAEAYMDSGHLRIKWMGILVYYSGIGPSGAYVVPGTVIYKIFGV